MKIMKKKILINVILLFCVINIYSQSKGGNATYSFILNFPEELKTHTPDNLSESMEIAIANAEHIELNLLFNKKQAVFSGGKQEGILNRNEDLALAWCGCSNDYYVDINSKITIYNSPESQMTRRKKDEYLIEKPMETNWELHNETKMINDIQCFKATQTITYNNGVKDFTKVITAWYAPSIPYSFGPNGYGGLAGLILELSDRFVTFGLKSIKFLDYDPEIIFPEKGKKVTYEEYNDILLKESEAIRENMKSMEFNRR